MGGGTPSISVYLYIKSSTAQKNHGEWHTLGWGATPYIKSEEGYSGGSVDQPPLEMIPTCGAWGPEEPRKAPKEPPAVPKSKFPQSNAEPTGGSTKNPTTPHGTPQKPGSGFLGVLHDPMLP